MEFLQSAKYNVVVTSENPENVTEICIDAALLFCEKIPNVIGCSCTVVDMSTGPVLIAEAV